MKLLFFILLFQNPCLQTDIMVVADYSGSVQGYEQYIEEGISNFVSQFELSDETVKVGVALFASEGELACELTNDENKLAKVTGYYGDGSTNMVAGLLISLDQFANNGRNGFRKIVIIISDGQPDDRVGALQAIEQMKAFDIMVLSVIVPSSGYNGEFMKQISSRYIETSFEDLGDEIKKLDICL